MSSTKPTRPILRYFGGKWVLAPWIIRHFPEHQIYVEPYGGAASVLLRKPRAQQAEVYNDLDSELVNLFRVCRDRGEELQRALYLTPYSREEFDLSYQPSEDSIKQARRTVIRSSMGYGGNAHNKEITGFRDYSRKNQTAIPAQDWANYPEALMAIIDRLRGVTIENRDALDVMAKHDSAETLHYVDPPYVCSTRGERNRYRHEMTDDDHRALAEVLHSLRGMIILSGYDCPLYRELYDDWRTDKRRAYADGARAREEVLWISPNTPARLGKLFNETEVIP